MSNVRSAATLVLAAAALAATPAWAVKVDVDGYFYDLPAGAAKNLDAVRALVAASDALGMTRRDRGGDCAANTNCLGTSTASHEYRASGTWNGAKADLVVIDFDYREPAIRTDVTTADQKRSVTVAASGKTWDEKTPGIFDKTGSETAVGRLLPVYLLPHAVPYFGALAADKVKLSTVGGSKVLTIPLPAPVNADLKATLDGNNRPVHTEIAVGGKVYSGDFENFTNDHMDYHVYGPSHIIEKVDGKVMADLNVEWHWTGPYMVFQTPKELAQK